MSKKTKLEVGDSLKGGQSLWSPNGQQELRYQSDGNLVLYNRTSDAEDPVWASMTNGCSVGMVTLLSNASLCLKDAGGRFVWNSSGPRVPGGVAKEQGAYLAVENSGRWAIYPDVAAESPLWDSNRDKEKKEKVMFKVQQDQKAREKVELIREPAVMTMQPVEMTMRPAEMSMLGSLEEPSDVIRNGQVLSPGSSLLSEAGRYRLEFLENGDLAVFRNFGDKCNVWRSFTLGLDPTSLKMEDGQLNMYNAKGRRVWGSKNKDPGEYVKIQDDGNFVMYPLGGGDAVWASNSWDSKSSKKKKHGVNSVARVSETPGALFGSTVSSASDAERLSSDPMATAM